MTDRVRMTGRIVEIYEHRGEKRTLVDFPDLLISPITIPAVLLEMAGISPIEEGVALRATVDCEAREEIDIHPSDITPVEDSTVSYGIESPRL